MMVSPLNNWSTSIVAGLRVATVRRYQVYLTDKELVNPYQSYHLQKIRLQ